MPVLRFGLLGPVTATYDGRPVPLGPPQRRAVLACLLLARGRAVTVAALKEMLWRHDAVPASAGNAIQGHVHHLRRTFDEFAPEPLLITHPGQPPDRVSYTLRADADGVDVMRFESLVREGEAAAFRGDGREAVEHFDEALALWRGEPLADLDSDYFRAVRRELEELRADADRRRTAAMRAMAWTLPSPPPPARSPIREPRPPSEPPPVRSAAAEPPGGGSEGRAEAKGARGPRAEARVLGPLELIVDGVDVTPAAARRRALLASLLRQPGHVVTTETLVEDVWGDDASANAPAQLQNHVHLLRKRIDQVSGPGAGKRVLERKPAGYVLNAEATDRDQFVSLVDEARDAFRATDHGRARDLAAQALKLSRGAPFAGVPLGSPRMVDAVRLLEEQRYEALHLKIEAQILLGESSRVVPELRNVVGRERPEDEGFLRLLIRALERTGRTAEARSLAGRLPRERHEDVPRPHDDHAEAPGVSVRPLPRAARSARPESRQLRFAVLGPVRAQYGDEPVNTGSPQQRGVLAALLLRAGHTATAPELIDAIWGDQPPHAALAALRTYASRLRKALRDRYDVLVSESGGYALRLDDSWFDLQAAQKWADEAERAREAGDRVSALTLLDRALGLFQGEPLAGLPGPYMEEQRSRLAEWRLQLVEVRCELMLELGRHAEAVADLTALTAAHPLRERLRELLMLALYRSGRQSEALAVYADTRRLLAEELGVDPRPELSELRQRILQADVEPASRPGEPAALRLVRPAQLPADLNDFVGRDEELRRIGDQLSAGADARMRTVVITGLAGVGKTSLAVHAAHGARREFPDGELYAALGGAGPQPPAEPASVLGAFLRALGVPGSAIPDGVEERAALFRSALDGHRVLIVLDNARDAAQVRPLLPAAPGCGTLVTSRVRIPDLPNAYPVDLGVLSPQEAMRLFSGIVGRERVEAEREAAMEVVTACGFLPLAIRIVANHLVSRHTWPISVLARRLTGTQRRLSELEPGYLELFALSYRQLPPAQARAFRRLGLTTDPDIPLTAAAAVLGVDEDTAEELLESLADRSLLESPAPGRYRMHPLLRAYARSRAHEDESPEEAGALTITSPVIASTPLPPAE